MSIPWAQMGLHHPRLSPGFNFTAGIFRSHQPGSMEPTTRQRKRHRAFHGKAHVHAQDGGRHENFYASATLYYPKKENSQGPETGGEATAVQRFPPYTSTRPPDIFAKFGRRRLRGGCGPYYYGQGQWATTGLFHSCQLTGGGQTRRKSDGLLDSGYVQPSVLVKFGRQLWGQQTRPSQCRRE